MAERSTPPVRASGDLAGARLPLAVAGFAAISSLTALAAGSIWGAFSDPDAAGLQDELADHDAAGEQALAALDEAKAEAEAGRVAIWEERRNAAAHRAGELALLATLRAAEAKRKTGSLRLALPRSWKLAENEGVGLVDLARNRIVAFEGPGIAAGSTLSAALPVLARALERQPKRRSAPFTVTDQTGVWSVGPAIGADSYAIARIDLDTDLRSSKSIDRARRLIGGIVAPALSPETTIDPVSIMLLGALLGTIAAGWWARRRVTAPIARALEVGREFVHGRTEVRADPNRGGRDAREVAIAINALIDRAERAMESGRAARGDDLSNAVLAIERLGKGDLREAIVLRSPTFGPIAQAIERARRDLLERVTEMHHAAMQVATHASEVAPAARVISESNGEQLSSLRRLAASSEEHVDAIRRKGVELEIAVNTLSATAQEHRQTLQEVRASLSGLSRRVMALRGTAEEAEVLSARAESIDQALSMLSRLAGQSDVPATKARATTLVGDARAALSEIGEKLEALKQETIRAAHGLEILAQAQPEPPKMFETSVTQPFYDAASILVRTVELTVGCLNALERSTKNSAVAGEEMHDAARQAIELVPRLGTALSAIRLGTSFEEQLLERLARMKAEVDAAKRTDGLTPDGERMLAEVLEASETARTKLARLAHATEAAIRAMRG